MSMAYFAADFLGFSAGFSKGRPKHDHNHLLSSSRGTAFSFLGYPQMPHQMPLLHSGTQRKHKDFASDVPSNAVLMHIRCIFFGGGGIWLWLCLGRP